MEEKQRIKVKKEEKKESSERRKSSKNQNAEEQTDQSLSILDTEMKDEKLRDQIVIELREPEFNEEAKHIRKIKELENIKQKGKAAQAFIHLINTKVFNSSH